MSAALAGADALGGLGQRGMQDRTGGDAGEDAFGFEQIAGTSHGIARADREPCVDQRCVVQLGHEAFVEVAQAVDEFAVARLGGHDPHLGLVLAEESADPHQRAGGAEPADEVRDGREIGQDLRTGAFVVSKRVGRIAVLIEHHPVGVLVSQSLGDPYGFVGSTGRRRGDDLGAPHLKELATLDRGVLRHHADQAIAAQLARHRQRDPGVARRRLEDRAVRAAACRPSRPRRASRALRGP